MRLTETGFLRTNRTRCLCDEVLKPGLRNVRGPGFLYNQTEDERPGLAAAGCARREPLREETRVRLLKKFGAVLYLAAAIVVVGGFACAQFAPPLISRRIDALLNHPAGRIALIASLVVVGAGVLLSALVALFEQRPPSSVHPAGNPGIEVRLAALASAARVAAQAEDVLVEDVRARVVGHNEDQVRMTLEVIAFTNTGLEPLGRRIEERVRQACEQLLGATGVTVLVRFLPSKTTTVTREVSGE